MFLMLFTNGESDAAFQAKSKHRLSRDTSIAKNDSIQGEVEERRDMMALLDLYRDTKGLEHGIVH